MLVVLPFITLVFDVFAKPLNTRFISVYQTENFNKGIIQDTYERLPLFKGGERALEEYMKRELRYPEAAKKDSIQGTVAVKFLIDKEGKIHNTKVIRGIHPLLDEEALRIINAMPDWDPGRFNGKVVDVYYTIPIKFIFPSYEIKSLKRQLFPYNKVQKKPKFHGGEQMMMDFIKSNLKYPTIAQREDISGIVSIKFIVNREGGIEKVLEPRFINLSKKSEGSKIDFILQTEALNAIRKMPYWNPGKISGKAVDVTCTIAIKFSMASDDRKSENEKITKMGDFPLIAIFGH